MKKKFLTQAVHAGSDLNKNYGAISMPIYNASTYAFENAEKGSAIHEGKTPRYFYSRINNPTQQCLEAALTELENGEASIAFSSGMAAISNGILTLLKSGDHIIAPESIYASTGSFFSHLQLNFGIDVTFVDNTRPEQYRKAINDKTTVLYLESPANPTLKLTDINAIVSIAKEFDLTTVMGNTFATPYNQQPLSKGIDIVIHSLTKYIGGHADILGGALIGSKEFVRKCRWTTNKYFGGVIAPQTAWLALRGIKTLGVRMERHNENALNVAEFLNYHPKVLKVQYPGWEVLF